MKPIIEVNHLSKKYKYGESQPYYTLRDTLTSFIKRPFRLNDDSGQNILTKEEFWALKDISFKVSPGETLGIIGPNGAGKSTLLKILSRITPPSSGNIVLSGRVGSLLEIGSGFHQELTGRENIYLNGAILGMSRREINKKFDEIVDFSGVERFLDTPVKHYSSGMYTRLAFSVAANLESEILVVDEVLAVGDAEFQRKCIDKIYEVTKNQGRTALFVSHNMSSIERLCKRCILLEGGRLRKIGSTELVINEYSQNVNVTQNVLKKKIRRQGNGKIRVSKIIFKDAKGRMSNEIASGKKCEIDIFCEYNSKTIKGFNISVGIDSLMSSSRVAFIGSKILSKKLIPRYGSPIRIFIDNTPLLSGQYSITIFLDADGEVLDWVENAAMFSIKSKDRFGNRSLIPQGQGDLLIKYDISQPTQ